MQYLRAIAALLVAVSHVDGYTSTGGLSLGMQTYGAAGVYIFFVISGFVIWHSANAGQSIRSFYWRRIVRIVPLYWLLLTVLILMLGARFLGQDGPSWIAHAAASYLFIAWPYPGEAGLVAPPLVPGWSLNYEMMFYALFGVLLTVPERWRLVGLFLALGSLVALGSAVASPSAQLRFYSSPMILLFPVGAALAVLVARGLRIGLAPALASIAGGFVLLAGPFAMDLEMQVFAGSVLIVCGAVLYEAGHPVPQARFAMLLGDASYSIYLAHTIVLMVLASAFRATIGLDDPATAGVFALVAIAAILSTSLALYFGFEKPSLKSLRARGGKPGVVG